MKQLLKFASELNANSGINKELLSKIEYDNSIYDKKFNIEIIIANPSYFNIEGKQKDRKAIYIFSKLIDLENNILKIIQNISKNNCIYYIYFLGYGAKLNQKIMPNFKTLLDKNVFLLL